MNRSMTRAAGLALAASVAALPAVTANAAQWTLDSSHSQVVFSYNHLGYSTTYGMFSGFTGEITFDPEKPEQGSVSVEIPTEALITGWPQRDQHFLSADFFDKDAAPAITFTSTAIEVTGENTANITGDLTMNNITRPVVLETVFNGIRPHPQANTDWTGFSATTNILRSEWDMGLAAPFVSDEVAIAIEIEAQPAE